MKIKKIFISALAVVFIAAAAFSSGCSTDSRTWVLKTLRENFYFYDEMNKEGLEELSLEEIVARVKSQDIYSEYYTAEEYEAVVKDYAGNKAGIGFSYMFVEAGASTVYPDGGCVVALVMGNSPAEKSGMRAGQILTSGTYNGETVAFEKQGDLDAFISPIKTDVRFTLTDGAGVDHEVYKTEYVASYMFMATAETAFSPTLSGSGKVTGVAEVSDRAIEYLPEGCAYVSMSQFFGNAADEFGYLMEKFNALNCKSLILDLRSNGGGYVDVMCDMAGYFTSSLDGGTRVAMTAEYRNGHKEIYNCKSHSGNGLVPVDTTVYVLANSGTASASEALIGVLVDYGFVEPENILLSDFSEEFTAWSDGEYGTKRSYGKGIMQSPFVNFWTREVLKLTTAEIFWPNGKSIHGVGVTTYDGCRTVEADWIVTPDDSELKNAVEIIKGE